MQSLCHCTAGVLGDMSALENNVFVRILFLLGGVPGDVPWLNLGWQLFVSGVVFFIYFLYCYCLFFIDSVDFCGYVLRLSIAAFYFHF